MKKILFVSHDASRTGAPITFLTFINWFKNNSEIEFDILLLNGGNLFDQFSSLAPTYTHDKTIFNHIIVKKLYKKLTKKERKYKLPKKLRSKKYNLIYINTCVSISIINELKLTYNCPVICHIHENSYSLKAYYNEIMKKSNLAQVDHFIAASESTKSNLIESYNIEAEKISLVYESISLEKMRKPNELKANVLNELGLSGAFIIGGCGLQSWRKGIDLFVQLGAVLNKIDPNNNIKLLWVGNLNDEFMTQFEYECKRLGIEDKIIFTGEKKDPQNYFQVFDVFALTSREDPFPLVVLEVAAQQKPILFFEQSGGIGEQFINNESGFVVKYGDVYEMAQTVLRLQKNYSELTKVGTAGESLVQKFDVSQKGPELLSIVELYIS